MQAAKRPSRSLYTGLLVFFLGWLAFLALRGLPPRPAAAAGEGPLPPPPILASRAAVLADAESGALLVTERAHAKLPPGELTRIVTAWVLLREESLPSHVPISRDALAAPGDALPFREGERVLVEELLFLMLQRPGAGSAVALAELAAGSEEAFTRLMNLQAEALGAYGSRFANPHGLDQEGHWSTAHDLALFARAAAADARIAKVLAGSRGQGRRGERGRERVPINSFLLREPRAQGAVTSFTPGSGFSLVAVAAEGGRRLLVVLVGAPSGEERLRDAKALLDYGFAHYERLLEAPRIDRVPYRVRPGDTLSGLARRFDVPIAAIRALNGLGDPDQLTEGQSLWIPR